MFHQKRSSHNVTAPACTDFASTRSGGQDKLVVQHFLHEEFFRLLSMIQDSGSVPLNEAAHSFLERIYLNGRLIRDRELTGLFRLSRKHGTPQFNELLDKQFILDRGRVYSRGSSLLKSSYSGFSWPESVE